MKVETQELDDCQVELTVEVPDERVESAKRATAKRMSKNTRIPGFRPGKAPYEVIVGKYGEEVIFEEALEDLGQEAYRSALDDAELEPYAPGSLEEIVSRSPLVLRFTVPLVPQVDLGNYRDIRIPYEEPEVTDEAVDAMLEDLRQRQALIEPVERPAEASDVVVLDITGDLIEPEEGEDAELVRQEDLSLLVEESTDFPFPGVHEHLLGMVAEDEKTVAYTFPDDYGAEDLQNKEATFTFMCKGVRSRLVPEWSDDLAKSVGEFEDLLDLRIKARESLQNQAIHDAESTYAEEVMVAVMEGATVTYPPIVLESELERLTRELEVQLNSQNLSFDDYLKIEGKNVEEVREEFIPTAEQRVSRGLILGQVVEEEDLNVEEDEISEEIERMLEPLGDSGNESLREVFDTPEGRSRIGVDLLTNKAMNHLMSIAKGEAEDPDAATSAAIEDESIEEESSQDTKE